MAKKPKKRRPTEECPVCGAKFPAGRPACPECGNDAETGWKADHGAGGVDGDFDEDDYREAVADLHPARPDLWTPRQRRNLIVGLLIVAAFLLPALVLFSRYLMR